MDPDKLNYNVLKMLAEAGLPLQAQPGEHCPDFPTDLADLSLRELSEYLQHFTAWAGYASGLEAASKNEVLVYEHSLDYIGAKHFIIAPGNTTTKRESKIVNDEYVKTRDLLLEAKARYELLKVNRERLAKYADAISRQITIIQLEQKI